MIKLILQRIADFVSIFLSAHLFVWLGNPGLVAAFFSGFFLKLSGQALTPLPSLLPGHYKKNFFCGFPYLSIVSLLCYNFLCSIIILNLY